MNIKLLQQYLEICANVGVAGTPGGFYRYIEDNYPELLRKMNKDIIIMMFRGVKDE